MLRNMFSAAEFQFLYGTIKSKNEIPKPDYNKTFQFLYGTIKRILFPIAVVGRALFQFLYGTIKRKSTRLG